jgi:hypothetical protein
MSFSPLISRAARALAVFILESKHAGGLLAMRGRGV